MDHVVEVSTDYGVLLIADSQLRRDMSEEFLYWFSAFTDPEGTTEISCDFAQPWPTVWRRAAAKMSELGASGRFVVIKSAPGRYFARVVFAGSVDVSSKLLHDSSTAALTVKSGRVEFSDGFSSDGTSFIATPQGEYEVCVHTLKAPNELEQTVGIFGSPDHPALLITLDPTEAASKTIPLVSCSAAALPAEPSPGRLCRAEIKKIEDSIAILRLQVAERMWSGYGRLRITPQDNLVSGSRVVIRLREHTGSWWWCDLPRPAA